MKTPTLLIFFTITLSLIASAQKIPIPENYQVIDSVYGDLDNDGEKELVVAYNMEKEDDSQKNIPRELRIFKLQNGKWAIWKKSQQALYKSREGGMMGDPFGEIIIEKGILSISQNGGSSWKWGHTDKYRYQDGEFCLIGYTGASGRPCEYWMDVDFNLSTGKVIVKKEYENCEKSDQRVYKRENEIFYKKGLKITMQDRNETEIMIVTPKFGHKIYIAEKNE